VENRRIVLSKNTGNIVSLIVSFLRITCPFILSITCYISRGTHSKFGVKFKTKFVRSFLLFLVLKSMKFFLSANAKPYAKRLKYVGQGPRWSCLMKEP
jgi:hypothetical protein